MKELLNLIVADLEAVSVSLAVLETGRTGEQAKTARELFAAQQKRHFDRLRKMIGALSDSV
jgi:hypothetical protein